MAVMASTTNRPRMSAAARRRQLIGLLFVSPWLIGFMLWTIYPLISSLYYSFTRYDLLRPPVFIGLKNYIEIFSDPFGGPITRYHRAERRWAWLPPSSQRCLTRRCGGSTFRAISSRLSCPRWWRWCGSSWSTSSTAPSTPLQSLGLPVIPSSPTRPLPSRRSS